MMKTPALPFVNATLPFAKWDEGMPASSELPIYRINPIFTASGMAIGHLPV
jgi:hypothetical protein